MEIVQVPYEETKLFSKIVIDYLGEKEQLRPFYNAPCNIQSLEKVMKDRETQPVNREVLVDALVHQYDGIEMSSMTKHNIQKLKDSNCYTVTTGHQLNLFTGPLYFVYKIISTIVLAKKLKAHYPENDFVPIYWMAAEDHDFEEVNHFNLFEVTHSLGKKKEGAVGNMKLDGMDEIMETLKGRMREEEEILNLFSTHYSSEKTFAEATRSFVNHVFGAYGLVILDGNDKKLKEGIIDLVTSELVERKSHESVLSVTSKLNGLGYKTQVNPREINLFYLKENVRERIVFEEGNYKVLNTNIIFTESEIIDHVHIHPERFSPNVILRPLYQEKILPNIAYVGGGGELAYWLQLKGLFQDNRVPYPTLVLRNSVLIVDARSDEKLQKLGLKPEELFKHVDVLIKDHLHRKSDEQLNLQGEREKMTTVFEGILKKIKAIDKSLEAAAEAELKKALKGLSNLESRLMRSEKNKEAVAINQIRKLQDKLFPKGQLQERHDNILSPLLLFGFEFLDELFEVLDPLEKQFTIIRK